ncbi:MAG: thiol-disulfide isomerase/thioredoxin [Cyclobacteriaceae bacterium]|jgi:thiol-disulfide isomerase/thioredoxin
MKKYIMILVFSGLFYSCQQKPDTFLNSLKVTGLDGQAVNLERLKGKVIILNLWATWCKPCVEEMPSLEVLQSKLPAEKFVLLLASNESLEKIEKFKQKDNFKLEFIKLESALESLGVFALPTTIFIDKEGKRSYTESGGKDWGTVESVQEILKLY